MDVRVRGSGGGLGWPEPGCRCASCLRAGAGGVTRGPSRVILDGTLLVGDGGLSAGGSPLALAAGAHRELGGYRIVRLAGGWDVTGPDGARLLCADGPGASPAVPEGVARYDAVLLDLLGDPAQLGGLRARGLATQTTVAVALYADHRARSERELARRCRIWRAVLPRDGHTMTVPVPDTEQTCPGAQRPLRVLVLGGARSGKSEEAEMRVAAEPEVTYVATGPASPTGPGSGADADWAARIAAHQARRPWWWRTVESTDLAAVLRQTRGAILADSVTTWLAAAMDECGAWASSGAAAGKLAARIDELVAAWRRVDGYAVAVSDETGLGIVPETRSGRLFRDELGRLNQLLAAESDEVSVVMAGRAQTLPD